MLRITVADSLVLDDEMFELVREALGVYASDQVEGFTWDRFVARESWGLIPDVENPDEPFFKAEMIVKNGPPWNQTVKVNVWRSPDLRHSGEPWPHSHPWSFTGHLLMGGYEEDRYTVSGGWGEGDVYDFQAYGNVSLDPDVVHQAGDANFIPSTTFHEVKRILEPGRTVSLMDCGMGKKEGWGYLDPQTGLYTPNKLSPIDTRYKPLLYARNPHLRKA